MFSALYTTRKKDPERKEDRTRYAYVNPQRIVRHPYRGPGKVFGGAHSPSGA